MKTAIIINSAILVLIIVGAFWLFGGFNKQEKVINLQNSSQASQR